MDLKYDDIAGMFSLQNSKELRYVVQNDLLNLERTPLVTNGFGDEFNFEHFLKNYVNFERPDSYYVFNDSTLIGVEQMKSTFSKITRKGAEFQIEYGNFKQESINEAHRLNTSHYNNFKESNLDVSLEHLEKSVLNVVESHLSNKSYYMNSLDTIGETIDVNIENKSLIFVVALDSFEVTLIENNKRSGTKTVVKAPEFTYLACLSDKFLSIFDNGIPIIFLKHLPNSLFGDRRPRYGYLIIDSYETFIKFRNENMAKYNLQECEIHINGQRIYSHTAHKI